MHEPQPRVNFDQRVQQYVKLRDKIKEIKEEQEKFLAPYKQALESLDAVLLNHLIAVGADSVKTESGTVYKTSQTSATLADKTAFWNYVSSNSAYELLDYKANKTAVKDYVEQHQAAPPGVNFSQAWTVGVRRK
jgi:hypothetical protein